MNVHQDLWTPEAGWRSAGPPSFAPQLVLAFGSIDILERPGLYYELAARYPQARIACCSTAGEIYGNSVLDNSLTTAAIAFAHTRIEAAQVEIDAATDSREAGQRLAAGLPKDELAYVLVLSDGLHVNGSELSIGLEEGLPAGTIVTGGLSADGSRFGHTLVGLDGPPRERIIIAIGFYGRRLVVRHGSLGGWDPFGPDRLVTRSEGNILYELDGQSALQLYKQYLGTYASELPASGLFFPLLVHPEQESGGVVRAILGINEEAQSLTFAADIPEGSYARLMKANFDRLIEGAVGAAGLCRPSADNPPPTLALLISCVGRKLVLQQRVEEEVEGVRDILGDTTAYTGFYSYGELSPLTPGANCELHNQTMTITTFAER